MKIVMKDTVPGSVDGINTAIYKAGQEYDLSSTTGGRALAAAFVGADLAEEVSAAPAASEPAGRSAGADQASASNGDEQVQARQAKLGRKQKAP